LCWVWHDTSLPAVGKLRAIETSSKPRKKLNHLVCSTAATHFPCILARSIAIGTDQALLVSENSSSKSWLLLNASSKWRRSQKSATQMRFESSRNVMVGLSQLLVTISQSHDESPPRLIPDQGFFITHDLLLSTLACWILQMFFLQNVSVTPRYGRLLNSSIDNELCSARPDDPKSGWRGVAAERPFPTPVPHSPHASPGKENTSDRPGMGAIGLCRVGNRSPHVWRWGPAGWIGLYLSPAICGSGNFISSLRPF